MSESADARSLKIKALVEEMKLYNNPQELEDLKKEIKKNVPFTMRGYFMAYLYRTSRFFSNPAKEAKPKTEREPRPEMADAQALYINVGKQSRSSAKDLARFIVETANIDDSSILSIAFKQNYSFVYVPKAQAQAVIDAVNGQSFKNRKVKINYSKEKDEN